MVGCRIVARSAQGIIENNAEAAYIWLANGLAISRMPYATIAIATAGMASSEGCAVTAAQRIAQATASFAGPMRANLVATVDSVGVSSFLGIDSAVELFGTQRHLVHYTSTLRSPVFLSGKNYSGSPAILRHARMCSQADNYLAEEAQALPKARRVPFGHVVTIALQHVICRALLNKSRLLFEILYPSAPNVERISVFLGGKDPARASTKTNGDWLLKTCAMVEQKITNLRLGYDKRS